MRPNPTALLVTGAGLSLAAVTAALMGLEIDRSAVPEAAAANLESLRLFWIASASAWAALTALWAVVLRRGAAARWRARDVALLAGLAIAARIGVLLFAEPALSDDVYRYLFDGRNVARHVNPYGAAPAERPDLAVNVNNPALHTIYLPGSQWIFGAIAKLVPESSPPPAGARVFRAVFVCLDLATIALLLLAARGAGRSPWWVALYAWHPLPLAEIAGSGHQEPLGIALLVAAMLLWTRAPGKVWRWTGCLALAATVKPVVLPVAALLLKRHRPLQWLASAAFGAAVCLLVVAPMLAFDAGARDNLAATARVFGLKWAHFGGVYEPLLWAIERATPRWTNDGQERLARILCAAALAAALVAIWRVARDAWSGARAMLLAMVMLSPAAHPWYLLWALALVPMAGGSAAWVASLTIPWGYAAWAHAAPDGSARWGVPAWLLLAAWAPVYSAVLIEVTRHRLLHFVPSCLRASVPAL